MQWSDVLSNPWLQNLPFKIELNRWGRIEMSPASNQHGAAQVELAAELRKKRGGKVIVECSVQTTDGVRVADVAWVSNARLKELGWATPFPKAPELCVEIMSPANTWAEMHMKAGLYLQAGAEQVWVVGLDGKKTVIHPPAAPDNKAKK
jgi:Uma2 family endonuclease